MRPSQIYEFLFATSFAKVVYPGAEKNCIKEANSQTYYLDLYKDILSDTSLSLSLTKQST